MWKFSSLKQHMGITPQCSWIQSSGKAQRHSLQDAPLQDCRDVAVHSITHGSGPTFMQRLPTFKLLTDGPGFFAGH